MSMPKSVIKMRKGNGYKVEYTSNVDRVNYTIEELTRAALRDVGKFVAKQTRLKLGRKSGVLHRQTQYWVRKRETDLQVGFKPRGFYGGFFEEGASHIERERNLYNAVAENISTIREIEGKYLSAIEDENRAKSLIDESEAQGE